MKNLDKKQKFIIACHSRLYGIPDALRDYLVEKKINSVLYIAHPLDNVLGKSFIEIYKYGKKLKVIEVKRFEVFAALNYVYDFLLTFWWVYVKQASKYDVFIGVDNLNALCGIVLKKLGRVDKTIYYSLDYSNQRFKRNFLNYIYHWIEEFSVKHADEVWNSSIGITKAREQYLNINSNKYLQKIVPTGVWNGIVKLKPFNSISKHQLVFVGHILEKQGIQKVLESTPLITRTIKDFKFVIIGGGDYRSELDKLVAKLKLEKHVEFKGIVSDHKELHEILSISAVGIAPYKPTKDRTKNFTYFGDPGKIKDYLNMGLPVIMTDVSYNARDLEKAGCGIVVSYSTKDIATAVINTMKDIEVLKQYRSNATKRAKEFDWHLIFDRALLY